MAFAPLERSRERNTRSSASSILAALWLLNGLACSAAPGTYPSSDDARDAGDSPTASAPNPIRTAEARSALQVLERAGLAVRADGAARLQLVEGELHARSRHTSVHLPAESAAPFRLRDERSSASIAVRLRGAVSVPVQVDEDFAVYPGGHERGDVIVRARPDGAEDFILLRERGRASLEYEVSLENGIRGLRLGDGSLEFVDAGGAPRLRVASPYLIDRDGRRVEGELGLEGCAYDTSLAPPWNRAPVPPGNDRCLVRVTWPDEGISYPVVVDPAWQSTNNLKTARYEHAATLLGNGLVLVSGGTSWTGSGGSCTGVIVKTAELFDPTTLTFAFTGSTTGSYWYHRAITLTSGKALIAGSQHPASYTASEVYDPILGTWSSGGALDGTRSTAALAPLPSGGAMLFGGANSTPTVLKTTLVYTPGAGWTAGSPMNAVRINHDAIVLDDASILVVAGTNQTGMNVPSSERYVPGVGWDAPVALAASGGQAYKKIAALGSGKVLLGLVGATQTYDPSTKAWTSITSAGAYDAKVASMGTGQVLLLGSTNMAAMASAQIYDSVTGFSSTTVPLVARYPWGSTLTRLANGNVLLTGGNRVDGTCATNDAEVFVVCATISISPSSLPDASLGTTYSQSVSSTGGAAPVTYAVTSGALPTGLTLASDGALTGTTGANGSYSFTVTATDANGCKAQKAYTVNVSCAPISVAPAALSGTTAGTAYSQSISSSGGSGMMSYAVTSGALPSGVTLSSDGLLSGSPTVTGSFSFTATATDALGCTGSRAYSLDVGCAAIDIAPSALTAGTVGVAYDQIISSTGSVGLTTYAVISGGMPNGITLTAGGGLSGTPSSRGDFSFTVKATDSNACTGERMYSLSIGCGTISLSPSSLPAGTATTSYSQQVSSLGGYGTMTYTLAAGALPAGLSLSSDGLISGVPSETGDFSVTIRATDAVSCAGERSYTLTLGCPAITLSPSVLPSATEGAAYTQSVTSSGGVGATSYTVTAGALPNGLSLSSSGDLTGTPLVSGDFLFTITGTDANGCKGTRDYTLNVAGVVADAGSDAPLPDAGSDAPLPDAGADADADAELDADAAEASQVDATATDAFAPEGGDVDGSDASQVDVADAGVEAEAATGADAADGSEPVDVASGDAAVKADATGREAAALDARAEAAPAPEAGGTVPAPASDQDGGCGCRTAGRTNSPSRFWWLAIAAVAGVARRRRAAR